MIARSLQAKVLVFAVFFIGIVRIFKPEDNFLSLYIKIILTYISNKKRAVSPLIIY